MFDYGKPPFSINFRNGSYFIVDSFKHTMATSKKYEEALEIVKNIRKENPEIVYVDITQIHVPTIECIAHFFEELAKRGYIVLYPHFSKETEKKARQIASRVLTLYTTKDYEFEQIDQFERLINEPKIT